MIIQSFKRLSKALKYYSNVGFEYIDLPWVVHPETSAITKPVDSKDFYLTPNKVLVASAEQSFLEYYDKLDPKKMYCALTPCFRDEPFHDAMHKPYFYKVELFSRNVVHYPELIYHAQRFMGSTANYQLQRQYIHEFNVDLMLGGIELGSYGVRKFEGMMWTFGTGLAEPRFTNLLNQVLTHQKSELVPFVDHDGWDDAFHMHNTQVLKQLKVHASIYHNI